MRRSIIVEDHLRDVMDIEDFLFGIHELTPVERDRLLIITSEIFDNILTHSENLGTWIKIRVYKNTSLSVVFLFRSSNFENLANLARANRVYYDSASKRYRGLGLTMCKNLTRSIRYKIRDDYNIIRVLL